ncbi:MAG: YncE family protein [Proteobacteria bacterium]|nr:YncE family protein [Pseudomonadota bacterium]
MKSGLRLLQSFLVLAGLALSGAALAQAAPEYRIVKKVALGAPDRWDYVVFDASSGRVFVAHGDELTVVDAKSGEVAGHVKSFPGGTHGVAIVTASNRGYTDDGESGKAVSFNLKTLAVEKHIQAAEDADAVTFDPVSNHVFTINGDTGSITVIDPKTDAAVATINGGGKLEYAVPGENGKLFVNGAGTREVLSIDTATNKVVARWPVPDCESPHGLAIDTAGHRLFVSCLNAKLYVVDSQSGQIVTHVPIGKGSDAVVFDPQRKLVFSSNGKDGTISVIAAKDPHTYVPLAPIKTTISARTMGIDPATGRLFVAGADVSPTAAPDKKSGRIPTEPGSLKLWFLDPAQ